MVPFRSGEIWACAFFKPRLGIKHYHQGMFSCLWLQSSSSTWNCHVFFISQKQMQQQRPVAPGICRVPRGARGSFDTGLLHRKHVNTCISVDFLQKHSHEWKMSTHINTYTHANRHSDTPPTPTRHMLSVAFMSFAQTFDWSQKASKGRLFTS